MKKAQLTDLDTLTAIMEDFANEIETMPEQDKIDLAAKLKPTAKACKVIDDCVKEHVKKKLRHRAGSVLGHVFKAVLNIVPTVRLDQKALKEDLPSVHEEYSKSADDERITFELR